MISHQYFRLRLSATDNRPDDLVMFPMGQVDPAMQAELGPPVGEHTAARRQCRFHQIGIVAALEDHPMKFEIVGIVSVWLLLLSKLSPQTRQPLEINPFLRCHPHRCMAGADSFEIGCQFEHFGEPTRRHRGDEDAKVRPTLRKT